MTNQRIQQETDLKILKIIGILALIYVAIVVIFESLLGYFQPSGQSTLVITTTDDDGATSDRVLAHMESAGQLYVAANHWPRAWFRQANAHPEVEATVNGEKGNYLAVPVTDEEHMRVDGEHSLGPIFRILTGFPPRYFLRLDPR